MKHTLPPKIGPEELKTLLHPSEESRFSIALIVGISAATASLLLAAVLALVLPLVLLLAGSVWFGLRVAKAHLTANTVKVSDKNFPEIYAILQEVLYVLDYNKPVDIYIVEEGTVNAFLAKFFNTKFIILNSELVEDILEHDTLFQAKWVIARFIGALKAKHDRLLFLQIIINSIEKLKIFNVFLLPYERATQYSGDQIGLAVCGNLQQVMIAFQKFMVGNALSKKVSFEGIQEQKGEMDTFAFFARMYSTHPHVIDRFHNLLSFAQERYPAMYDSYMDTNLKKSSTL